MLRYVSKRALLLLLLVAGHVMCPSLAVRPWFRAEIDDELAGALLAEANGEVQRVGPDEAQHLLEETKGLLTNAIDQGVPPTKEQLEAVCPA